MGDSSAFAEGRRSQPSAPTDSRSSSRAALTPDRRPRPHLVRPGSAATLPERGAGLLLSCDRRPPPRARLATIAITWAPPTTSLILVRTDDAGAGADDRREALAPHHKRPSHRAGRRGCYRRKGTARQALGQAPDVFLLSARQLDGHAVPLASRIYLCPPLPSTSSRDRETIRVGVPDPDRRAQVCPAGSVGQRVLVPVTLTLATVVFVL
jgi:hypothetical protein